MSQAPHFNVREAKTERSGDLAGGVVKGCELGLESGFPALGPVLLYPQLVPLVTQSMDGELADGAGNPHPWELVGVQFSYSVESESLQPHGLQQARPPCPSPTPGACSNSCPSSVIPFSCLQSCPALGTFPMSHFFTSGSQSIGALASTSVLAMNIQDRFPLGWTGLISLQSKRLSRVFSNTTVQKHQFFGIQPSLWPNFHIHT